MKNQFKFKNFEYEVENNITPLDVSLAVKKFYNEILQYIETDRKLCVLFKIKISDDR
jgi:hypothetical protein